MSSSRVRERLANRTRVCSYDRLGQGWSDAAPGVTTIAGMADDLGVLQDRAKLTAPFVLVASSVGGLTAEMFARKYPERVAGIVFVDAATSVLIPRVVDRSWSITALTCTVGTLARFGVVRLMNPFGLAGDSEGARRSAGVTYGAKPWTAICSMVRGLSATQREFEQAPPLPPELPVTALSASSAQQLMPPFAEGVFDAERARNDLEASHRAFAERAHGTWKKVPNSTHLIADSQPDAVADAVFDLLDQLRRGGASASAEATADRP
jgi:pimeloyl-ACP methyl ester carboxylesterase